MDKVIQLSHGGGGKEMNSLIKDLFFKYFKNPILEKEEDAASLSVSPNIAFTSDSFTVNPLFFAGGNIGKLAIAGTVNDLAMAGARPDYLSCSVIIEEGFKISDLEIIVESMAKELSISGAKIVCGDTKVVPKGCADGIFINTSGVGNILCDTLSAHNIKKNDVIIVSRDIGAHGAAILMARNELELESDLISDCATLWPIINSLITNKIPMHALRDATRGGVAAVLNEWAKASAVGITIDANLVPISSPVNGLCELYGFEPLDLANEGTFILALPKENAEEALKIIKSFNANASIIGTCNMEHPQKVILKTPWNTSRFLDVPQGELLPRIC